MRPLRFVAADDHRTYEPIAAAPRRLSRPGRDGLSRWPGTCARRAPRHGLQPHAGEGRAMGRPSTAARARATPARGGARRRDRVRLRRQRRRPARGRRSASTARSPGMKPGRDLRRPHRPLRPRSRASSRALARDARACTSSTRRSRAAISGAINGALTVMCGGDAARSQAMPAGRDGVREGGHAARRERRRAARQDGQPDRDRRVSCRAWPRRSPSARRRAWTCGACSSVIGKGAAQSWQMDNRGTTMVDDQFDFGFAVDWMRKDLGLRARRSQAQRRAAAGDGAGRPVLCRHAGAGRQPRWTPRACCARLR